jgi:very-short-patch-repair endonuclease
MRRLYTTDELGLTRSALRWAERSGRWQRIDRGVWVQGSDAVTELDRARAAVLATGAVASHHLAGVLHGLDSVRLDGRWMTLPPTASGGRPRACRRHLEPERIACVAGLACTDGLQTVVDLASSLTDVVWEHALESALRKRLTSVDDLTAVMTGRAAGAVRARRVLTLRPGGAAPTESLLETLMVQLIRTVPGLPAPARQVWIEAARARLDLAWPELGLFIELDGQHHKDQPVYDARRETAVVAATGWLCGRFTWAEVVHLPNATARRLADLADQARRRPLGQLPRSSSATR